MQLRDRARSSFPILIKASTLGTGFRNLLEVDLKDKKDVCTRDLAAITLKRLELTRALASNPKVLLLDEVAAGLTEEEIPHILGILERVRKLGITYILIEHVMKVMTRAVDRIMVMDKGLKIAEGSPEKVMADKLVIEAYLGDDEDE